MSSYFLPRIYFGACLTFATILLFSFWSRTFLSEHFPMKSVTKSVQDVKSLNRLVLSNYSDKAKNDTAMKYILLYTNPRNVPFVYMGVGREAFISLSCPYTNCIVTGDKEYLNDITKFDVIAFSGPEILKLPNSYLPTARSPHQKYVFASIESSHYYPSCSNRFDGVFNWTWTFRLDSDVRWGYMLIRDSDNNIIGPNKIMHWTKVEEMAPVSKKFEEKMKTKTKAVAWFVSNCYDLSGRLRFAHHLLVELKKYDLELDIFGRCGPKSCPTDKHDECMKMVEKSYYFYLSFENSFSEDYVTEKLLQALKINVVPVVYGAANYTRFMPDGIYLNAREFSAQELAAKMNELIKDPKKYASYFKWKKYYSYHGKHEVPDTNEYCKMCEILNNENEMKKTTIIQNFRDWWDSPKMC